MPKSLSVIIPLYNEAKRITKTLPLVEEELDRMLAVHGITCDLILVNDGSTDNTLDILNSCSKFHRTQIVSLPRNSGKGAATKEGFAKVKPDSDNLYDGEYICFMDADLSTPLGYLGEFMDMVSDSKTIMIGTRKALPDSIIKPQRMIRQKLGQGFTVLANFILNTSVTDFTCGFKIFPAKAGKRIFNKITVNGWSFDAEAIYLARKYGYSIHEIPVVWSNDTETKVKLTRDIIYSFFGLLKIRLNNLFGVYGN